MAQSCVQNCYEQKTVIKDIIENEDHVEYKNILENDLKK